MPAIIGQHTVATFTSPVNGTTPIDANTVRGNDNTLRSSYNSHDQDPGIHLQSSTLGSRPAAGTAGRKWVTADAGSYKIWYDDGTRWHEVGNDAIDIEIVAGENLAKGDVVSVTGYNVGLGVATVAKFDGTAPAFGIVQETISNGSRGYIVNTGIIADVNTQAFGATGTILFPAATGTFTATKPTSGTYQVAAYVLRQNSTNGVLYVEFSGPRIVERSDNTVSTVVLRDASGNFAAGTITATSFVGAVTGNAATATALQNARTLWGQSFDGTANVSGALTGVTDVSASGTVTAGVFSGPLTGNASTATKLSSARTFALTGNVTGTQSSDLDSGVSIATTIANDVITNAMVNSAAAIAYSKLALTNSIVNADINASAAIADTKLATISTAGKVSNSATTATSANTNNAIVARDGSGNFSAGTISAALTGNASTATALQNARNLWGQSFNGTANVSGNLTGVGNITGTAGVALTAIAGTLALAATGANVITLATNGVERVQVGDSGIVRFQRTIAGFAPTTFLQIQNNATLQFGVTGNAGQIRFTLDGNVTSADGNAVIRAQQDGSGSNGTSLQLLTNANAGTPVERLRITAAGNVGIGTTNPGGRLQVEQAVSSAYSASSSSSGSPLGATVTIRNNGDINGSGCFVLFQATNINSQTSIGYVGGISGTGSGQTLSGGGLVFGTRISGPLNYQEHMRVTTAGNVGIGVTTPSERLSLVSGDIYQFSFKNSLASSVGALGYDSTDNMRFFVNNAERLRISSAGNVGIGTASPANKLTVRSTSGYVLDVSASETTTGAADTGAGIGLTGHDGINPRTWAGIIGAKENSSVGASNGYMSFITRNTAGTFAERLRITSDAYLRMASGSGGIQFNGDTAAANALDDYEEGTWTPTVVTQVNCSSSAFIASKSYTKIGRQVVVEFSGSLTVTATGTRVALVLGNVPFSIGDRVGGGGSVLDGSNQSLNPAISGFAATQMLLQFMPIATGNVNFTVVAIYRA